MKKTWLFLTLAAVLAVLAVPALAAPQTAAPADSEAPAAEAQLDIATWLAAGSDQAMQEAIAQTGVGQTAGCTAQTNCSHGTISCSGNNNCWSEPSCFVYCDTTGIIRCNNPCP